MSDQSFSGAALEEALRSGKLDRPVIELVGMVKAAETEGKISFTPTDCESWVEIPTDLIESAEQVGQRACREHAHPVVRLNLKQPKDPEAQILAQLLTSSRPSPMGSWSPGRGFPMLGGSPAASGPFALDRASRGSGVTVGPQGGVTVGPQGPTRGGVIAQQAGLGCTPCVIDYYGPNGWRPGHQTCTYLLCLDTPLGPWCNVISQTEYCENNFNLGSVIFGW
jgi:hypothetical protein